MTSAGAVGAALGGAASAALSTVLQHRSAGRTPKGRGLRLVLLARLLRQPMWLGGLLAAGAGLILNAFALHAGGLAVVQPLLLTGMLFALPLSMVLERRRPSAGEWGWAALLVAGLSGFLLVARPTTGQVPSDTEALAGVLLAGGTAAGLSIVVAKRLHRHRAPFIGIAGGITYGMTAALIKQVVQLTGGWAELPVRWPTYALVAVGVTALMLSQTAYQSGPIASSLPHLTMAELLTGISLGVLVFHERLTASPTALLAEVMSLLAVAVGVVQLSRRHARTALPQVPPASAPLPVPHRTRDLVATGPGTERPGGLGLYR